MSNKIRALPKIEDVARAAGVSVMSVSRALRNAPGVSEKTRERILSVAQEIGYERSLVASNLAGEQSTLIGISVPTLFDAVFAEILAGMQPTLDRKGFQTVLHTSNYDDAKVASWIDQIIAWRPAGVVLTGVDHSETVRDKLKRAAIPTLEIWDLNDEPIDVCVGVDHRQAGVDMASHLIDLGYRRPAYVGFSGALDRRAAQRLDGFRDRFAEFGAALSAFHISDESASFHAGFQGAVEVLSAKPDVLYFLNDHMAFGGLMACRRAGLDVPRDVGVVGFNDLNINTVLPQAITTTRTPRAEMGEKAAAALINRTVGADVPRIVRLPCSIVSGRTTRRLV